MKKTAEQQIIMKGRSEGATTMAVNEAKEQLAKTMAVPRCYIPDYPSTESKIMNFPLNPDAIPSVDSTYNTSEEASTSSAAVEEELAKILAEQAARKEQRRKERNKRKAAKKQALAVARNTEERRKVKKGATVAQLLKNRQV